MKKLVLIVLALLPVTAMAHVGDHSLINWKAGFLHPLTGLDHLLALIATGLWLAQGDARGRWGLIAGFGGVLALAIAVGMQFITTTFEVGIIASLVALGALLAGAVRGPQVLRALILAATAAIHGFIHGTELPADGGVALFACALVMSSVGIIGIAMMIGLQSQKFAKGVLARIAGAALMLFGVAMAF